MLLHLIIALIIIGALLYLVKLIPIDARFKQIIYIVAIVFVAIYLLEAFWPSIG